MAGTISAEAGALKKAQDAVSVAKTGIDRETKKVRDQILELGGYWTGPSATTFTGLMTRWDEETDNLSKVLITLEQALSDTETDQAETETQHQEAIKGLGAMMSGG